MNSLESANNEHNHQLEQPCAALWREDWGDRLFWGITFGWAAVILLVETTGYSQGFEQWDGWLVFFVGVGALLVAGAGLRAVAGQTEKAIWALVLGGIVLALCFATETFWAWALPLGLLAVSISILNKLLRRQ